MKSLILSFVLSCAFILVPIQNAFAYYSGGWKANARVTFTQTLVTASVYNSSQRPVICSGYAYGRVRSGQTMNAWMNQRVIYPNQNANVYVYTNFYQPFINAWADIRCRYL